MWFRDSLERFRTTSGISVRRCFRSLGIQGLGVGDRYTHIQICTHTYYCVLLLIAIIVTIIFYSYYYRRGGCGACVFANHCFQWLIRQLVVLWGVSLKCLKSRCRALWCY